MLLLLTVPLALFATGFHFPECLIENVLRGRLGRLRLFGLARLSTGLEDPLMDLIVDLLRLAAHVGRLFGTLAQSDGVALFSFRGRTDGSAFSLHAFLFGEDQGRYVLTCRPEAAAEIAASAKTLGIACQPIGTTGGDALTIPGGAAILLSDLRRQHDSWLPDYMQGQLILEEHA